MAPGVDGCDCVGVGVCGLFKEVACCSRISLVFCRNCVCGVLKLPPDILLAIESWRELRLCESGELVCELIGDISVTGLLCLGGVCCK